MTSRYRLDNGNAYTTLVPDVEGVGGYACVREEVYGNSLHFLLMFAVTLKLL
jgi:hypothetical protein